MLYYSCQSPATVTPLKYSFKQKLKSSSHLKYKPLITALYNKHKPLSVLMQFIDNNKLKILNTTRVEEDQRIKQTMRRKQLKDENPRSDTETQNRIIYADMN